MSCTLLASEIFRAFPVSEIPTQTPLYRAEHSDRYERQTLIQKYEEDHQARLVVVADIIGPWSITYFEELVFDANPSQDLHLMLDTPGGDGEVAVRIARSAQARCRELAIIVPDQAKSAGTLLAMGAHSILMGPIGDLGPVDPQLYLGNPNQPLVAAKDLVNAVEDALERTQDNPSSSAFLASLLSDVTYLMYQEAKASIERIHDLIEVALSSNPDRSDCEVNNLAEKLKQLTVADPKVHSAIFGIKEAGEAGLPVLSPSPEQWEIIWRLWTKYFYLRRQRAGLDPEGRSLRTLIYENRTASQVVTVPWT